MEVVNTKRVFLIFAISNTLDLFFKCCQIGRQINSNEWNNTLSFKINKKQESSPKKKWFDCISFQFQFQFQAYINKSTQQVELNYSFYNFVKLQLQKFNSIHLNVKYQKQNLTKLCQSIKTTKIVPKIIKASLYIQFDQQLNLTKSSLASYTSPNNMQYDNLSQNGIQKVLSNAPAIVQVIDYTIKIKNSAKFWIVELSDGFSSLKKCVIGEVGSNGMNKPVKQFDVLRTQLVQPYFKDDNPLHTLIEKYTIVRDDLTAMIGQPIQYLEWKSKKSNPKGQSSIPPAQKTKGQKKQITCKNQPNNIMNGLFDDQDDNTNNNNNNNKGKAQPPQKLNQSKKASQIPNKKNQPPAKRPSQVSNQQSNTNANSRPVVQSKPPTNLNTNNNININTNTNTRNPPNTNTSTNPNNNQQKGQQNNNNRAVNQQKQPRHQRDYTLIKELYQGMEDWKIKVRIIFCSQLRTFVKKTNGQESQVFSFQACDHGEFIELTGFGQTAASFAPIIELDSIYQISNGKISRDDQKGKLKIMLTERTTIALMPDDDLTIPMVDQFCLTPEQLLHKDIGTEWNVVALVKDCNQIVEFVSRNGKNCKKKEIYLCDPEAQMEVPITLWFQKADIVFQKIPYAFQGIVVSSYNQQRQFSTSLRFNYRPYKQHQYRKYVTSYQKMKLQNPVHDFSGKAKSNPDIFNFAILRRQAQKLEDKMSLSMQKVCYLTQISLTSKNYYLSCPHCKRKVFDQQRSMCISQKCGKSYQKAKYRYLLNVSLSDETQAIWVTAYDQAAEAMLTSDIDNSIITADQFVKIQQEDMKLKLPGFLDRQFKVTIVAKVEMYNGQKKVRFGVNKASLKIDYGYEAKVLEKQMEHLMEDLKNGGK